MQEYIIATGKEEYEAAIRLFKEYAAWLNIDLSFQSFEKELEGLAQMYNAADGGIILCKENGQYIACVAVRRQQDNIAELKRMYVQPLHQHKGIGKILLQHALELAVQCGYTAIRLDTLHTMVPAMNFYKQQGFYEIPAYYFNPQQAAVYFEKKL